MQPYLNSSLLTNKEKDTLLKLRSGMYPNIKANFKKQFNEDSCPLICTLNHIDNKKNILICPELIKDTDIKGIKYSDLFSALPKQIIAVRIYSKLLRKRENILNTTNKYQY